MKLLLLFLLALPAMGQSFLTYPIDTGGIAWKVEFKIPPEAIDTVIFWWHSYQKECWADSTLTAEIWIWDSVASAKSPTEDVFRRQKGTYEHNHKATFPGFMEWLDEEKKK